MIKKAKFPPVGPRPRFVIVEERIKELQEYFARCMESMREIPTEHVDEYNELISQIPEID